MDFQFLSAGYCVAMVMIHQVQRHRYVSPWEQTSELAAVESFHPVEPDHFDHFARPGYALALLRLLRRRNALPSFVRLAS